MTDLLAGVFICFRILFDMLDDVYRISGPVPVLPALKVNGQSK